MLNKLTKVAAGLLLIATATGANAQVSDITITNNTNLAMDTSVAGLPGNPINVNETRSVNYSIITMGCNFAGALNNCPISFYNKENGDLVATVNMNVTTASLVAAPTFHGDYGNKYEVIGWESSPLSQITFSEKA